MNYANGASKQRCPVCKGSGKNGNVDCVKCKGRGFIKPKRVDREE